MNPEVSIILPTYNRASVLKDAIASVLRQTYPDFELIVVDDGSTDGTRELVKDIYDSRLRYIGLEENSGHSHARNVGARSSIGEYLAFQDSDDIWHEEKLELLMETIKNCGAEVGVVYSSAIRVFDNKELRIPDESVERGNGELLRELLKANFICLPAAVIRRQCLDRVGYFDEKLPRLADWEMWMRIARYYQFKFVDEVLLTAYHMQDSVTANSDKYKEALRIILDKHEGDFLQNRKAYANHLHALGQAFCAKGAYEQGRGFALKAFKQYPLAFSHILLALLVCSGKRPCCFVMEIAVRMLDVFRKLK